MALFAIFGVHIDPVIGQAVIVFILGVGGDLIRRRLKEIHGLVNGQMQETRDDLKKALRQVNDLRDELIAERNRSAKARTRRRTDD